MVIGFVEAAGAQGVRLACSAVALLPTRARTRRA
jgi:hypothetical protein